MKPPLTLLLLSVCGLSSWGISLVTRVVTQSADGSVMEGETVNISCCFIMETLDVMKARISWLKNHKTINSSIVIWGNLNLGESVNSESNNCLTLTFSHIMRKDSGRYVCKLTVEIPVYKVLYENGTVITVRSAEITEDGTEVDTFDGASDDPQVLTHIMRCLPVLALFITFIYLYRSGSKAESHTPAGPGNKTTSDEERASENERREEEHNTLSYS